jgi:uncharacterized repeat protein (TIGR01451 family)
MALSACGGGRSASGGTSVLPDNLNLSQVGPSSVSAGTTATFTVLVVNTGRNEATNLVITETLTAGYTSTVTCSPSFGAICPGVLGPSMTLPSLASGKALTLTYQVAVPATSRGDIVHQVAVASDRDDDLSDNSSSITAVAIDGRNGAYKAYAADGKVYDLTIDFDALSYTMTGGAAPVTKTFVAGAGEYIVGGTQRLRSATDLVIGNHDFGGGVLLPYIAARKFGTTLVDGVFNLATRNVAADGTATTHPGTARISGNVLSVCQTDSSVSPTQACPVVLTSYMLSVTGDVYTGVDTSGGAPFTFQLARSGASIVMLSAQTASDTTQQLRVGLQESAGLAWGTVFGPSITLSAVDPDHPDDPGVPGAPAIPGVLADWVTMQLDAATISYSVLGSASPVPTNDQAGLQRISGAGPFAMMVGKRLTDSADIYVMQTAPLVVVVGAFDDKASGTFQVAVP